MTNFARPTSKPSPERRLDIEIKDRFGSSVVPREWFLVPLFLIDKVIDKIRAGTLTGCVYDPEAATLMLSGIALRGSKWAAAGAHPRGRRR